MTAAGVPATAGTADLLRGCCAGSAPLADTRGCRTRMSGFGFGAGVPPDISAGMMGSTGVWPMTDVRCAAAFSPWETVCRGHR